MKRLLSLLLVIAMLFGVCAMFTACDGNSVSSEKEEEKKEEEKKSNKVKLNMKGVTVEETVVYEGYGLILTLNDVDAEDEYVSFIFTLENTTDEYMNFESSSCLVNGISAVDSGLYCSIDAGATSTYELYLPAEQLEWMGVTTIGHLDMKFVVYDSNYNAVERDIPVTIETSKAGFVHTPPAEGDVLLEKEGIRVVLLDTVFNKKTGTQGMYVFVENTGNKTASISLNNISINGWFLPYTGLFATLPSGANTVRLLDLYGKENIGIKKASDIQNMTFSVIATDDEYYEIFSESDLSYVPGDKDFVYEMEDTGDVLLEDDNLCISQKDIEIEDGHLRISLYLQNKADDYLYYSIESLYINNQEYYCYFSVSLPDGAQCAYELQLWTDESLESLQDIDSIVGDLYIRSSYSDINLDTEVEFVLD